MERIFDSLPGVSMPVEKVSETLTHMWDAGMPGNGASTDFRASQMNLILHLGLSTTVHEAEELFQTAIEFAQKYPCRIVVLCPSEVPAGEYAFEGKLFSQCYIGKHLRDVCCCEALILGYSPDESDYLENQVSIWLESDLPTYHWFHRVPADRISQHYLGFIERCRRVIFDGEIEGDAYDAIDWPDSRRIKDLAYARTLPLRQHMGQFISRFPPRELIEGLQSLRFQYHKGMRRTVLQMLKWHRNALEKCFPRPADIDSVVFAFEQLVEEGSSSCMRIEWSYANPQHFLSCRYDVSLRSGLIQAGLPSGQFSHPLHIEPLPPQQSLSEAMFFC
ncbi:MAG: glucose-6-phosphate dehydrogenase assembly protein OpcA [Puniceicoccaceae bacterium]